MTKNLMPEVAKMLGVEVGEEFKAYDTEVGVYGSEIFVFTDKGLVRKEHPNVDTYHVLKGLLQGTIEIVKLPWEPKRDEFYYWPSASNKKVGLGRWHGDTFCCAMKALGMVYRTQEEAEANLSKDYERLTGKPLSGEAIV